MARRFLCAAFTAVLAAAASVPARAADIPRSLLMLDGGGHVSLIRSLIFTPDGRDLISAGNDKTIRIWDWRNGKTVRTIRGEAGTGAEGKIFAMALSPDARWLAVGGWMDFLSKDADHVRVFEYATGKLVALLKGHGNVVNDVAFSPDGKRLVSVSSDSTAMIWDVSQLPQARRLQHLEGHTGAVKRVTFTRDGQRVVTASSDKSMRLWNVADGAQIKVMAGHSGEIKSVAASPTNPVIASASLNGELFLWDDATGQRSKVFTKSEGEFSKIAFSPDGRWLVSTCSSDCNHQQHVWDTATGAKRMTYTRHNNLVAGLAISPDGQYVATAGGDDNEIHVWDPTKGDEGKVTALAGVGRSIWSAAFSADSTRIAWGSTSNDKSHADRGPLEWQMTLPREGSGFADPEQLSEERAATFQRGKHELRGAKLSHAQGGALNREDGILIIKSIGGTTARIVRDTTNGVRHFAYAFSADGQRIVSGGAGGWMFAYNPKGDVICRYDGHDSDVWAVAPSPDGRLLLSGADDQTVRLWNLKTCELLLTLFPTKAQEWVALTPQGVFAGSANAGKLVGWQLNNGPSKEAVHITGDELRDDLQRPDVLARAIAKASARTAVSEIMPKGFSLTTLLEKARR